MKYMTLSKVGNLIIFHKDNPDDGEVRRRVVFALNYPDAKRLLDKPDDFCCIEISKSDGIDEVWMKVLSSYKCYGE